MRPKHRRRALLTAQRVIDVAGGGHADLREARVECREIKPFQPGQRRTAGCQLTPFAIEKPRAQRLHHARAAIVGGAAADADDNRLHAPLQRREDKLAGAVTRGDARIALRGWHQMQTGSRRHFHHRRFTVAQQAEKTVDFVAERRGHRRGDDLPAGRGDHRLDGAFAAVRHRHTDVVRLRVDLTKARFDSLRDIHCAQAFLK